MRIDDGKDSQEVNVSTQSRRSFLRAAGAAGAGMGLTLATGPAAAAGLTVPASTAPLEHVEVVGGFIPQAGVDPAQVAQGGDMRTALRSSVLDAIEGARGRGYSEQLRAATRALEATASRMDPAGVREVWLRITGSVSDGATRVAELREWEYVAPTVSTR